MNKCGFNEAGIFFCCKRNDKDDKEDVYKATNDDKEENVYNNAKGDISGYEKEDVYIKFYMREYDNANRNAKDDVCKDVNEKGGLSG